MTDDTIFRILCEIYAKQEGLQVEKISKKNDRPACQRRAVG